ncbi:MAG: hypothetical protein LGR52_10130 [Candidatus Thiosymbion ectosymbiont of Robbea hypermnestra]|nr:hypothetical protein [Candidatus Thiosymbion ectosymbiont of Robbea hypermnestra]
MKRLFTIIPITVCVIIGNAYAAGSGGNGNPTTEEQNFGGLKFGIGLSLTVDTGNRDRIDEAKVVNNIVRVTEESNDIARFMLESHYFFTPDFSFLGVESGNWGCGPFVAVQPGKESIIEAVGFGGMIGFKRKNSKTSSWNIGIGMVVDPDTKVLGNGIEGNQPLPTGETEVRLKETSQWGALILTSFSF